MADYNALEALINAYIKQNGVKAITGQVLNGVLRGMVSALGKGWTIAEGDARPDTDPGTMTGPVAYVAHTAGTYTNFGGLVVNEGEVALLKYNEQTWTKEVLASLAANATIDGNVGTPAVGVSFQNGVLTFDFRNMKGNPGDSAGFGTVNATVDGTIGTPGVSVQSSGPDTAKNFTFAFTGLKGEAGVTSVVASVDNTTGNPSCSVSLVGQELHLDFSGLKGAQGDTGVSADYPIAIVNNLTTNDPASALSAAQGVVLAGQVSQLERKVDDLLFVNWLDQSTFVKGYYKNTDGSFVDQSSTNSVRLSITNYIKGGFVVKPIDNTWKVYSIVAYSQEGVIDGVVGSDYQLGETVEITGNKLYRLTMAHPDGYVSADTPCISVLRSSTSKVDDNDERVNEMEENVSTLLSVFGTTLDNAPTFGSDALVKSGGVYDMVKAVAMKTVGGDLSLAEADSVQDKLIKNDGDLQNANTIKTYLFKNDGYATVAATLGDNSTGRMCLAFYNSETPSSASLISGLQSQNSASFSISAVIPNGCVMIAVANNTSINASPSITIHKNNVIDGFDRRLSRSDAQTRLFTLSEQKTTENYYINTGVDIGETVSTTPVSNNTYCYCIVPCQKYDIFHFYGLGGSSPRLWAFTDSSYKLVSHQASSPNAEELKLMADVDGYFIFNSSKLRNPFVFKYTYTQALATLRLTDLNVAYDLFRTEVRNHIGFDFNLADKYSDFHLYSMDANVADYIAKWDAMAQSAPGWTKEDTTEDTGLTTPSEAPIPVYIYKHIANKVYSDKSTKLKVLVYTGEHANEKHGMYALLDLMGKITGGWADDYNCELASSLVDFYVIPCLNPWGFNNNSRVNYNGVNINRNYDSVGWIPRPEGDDYSGPYAASEFETQTIQWYVDNIKPDVMISIHTGGTNSHGAIGTIEYSIDDVNADVQTRINFGTMMCRTSSNMATKIDNNFPRNLSTPLYDLNVRKLTDVMALTPSDTDSISGTCSDYARDKGIKVPVLLELTAGSKWLNGVYSASNPAEISDTIHRINMIHLSNTMFNAIKMVAESL